MESYGASPEEAQAFTSNYGRTYWGDQPIVEAPAYIGAIVFFLFILALFHEKRKIKYIFLAGAILSLFLSWGKNFPILTNFFIDYVPMYDKFRAVSSIQVILEMCVPALAILGLHSFFTKNIDKQWDSLKKAAITTIGFFILLFLCRGLFNFSGPIDEQLYAMFNQMEDKSFGPDFVRALQQDRKSLYAADLLRSGFFVLLVIATFWLFIKNKFSQTTSVIIIGALLFLDLFFVAKNYVNADDFVSARQMDVPFEPTTADMQILQDKSNYRVLDIDGYMNGRASYFHKSIGGYSAVRPRKMQELFDYQIVNNNREVLNMLNVKYIIQSDEKGEPYAVKNPEANGNAWFISKLQKANSADDEMKALTKLKTKDVAVYSQVEPFIKRMPLKNSSFVKDSTATIQVVAYKPNNLKYISNNKNDGFAVFAEMYYKNGWTATIDGKTTPILRVNYTLRGLQIPAGKHTIEFKFEPQVVKTGSTITLISSVVMLLLFVGGIYYERKNVQ